MIESENIKVPNSLIITGLSCTEIDEEIVECLKRYGKISRIIEVSGVQGQSIIKYESGTAIKALEEQLPFDRTSDANPDIYRVDALANVYSVARGQGITGLFLSELRQMAKLSGKSFEQVMHKELTRINEVVGEQEQGDEAEIEREETEILLPTEQVVATPALPVLRKDSVLRDSEFVFDQYIPTSRLARVTSPDLAKSPSNIKSLEYASSPEVQRVVVEHVVKSAELSSQFHASPKLRMFSGRLPCPTSEVDYDT